MDRKHKYYIIGIVAGACIIAVLLIYGMTQWIRTEEAQVQESAGIQTDNAESRYQYRMTEYRGHIGIYDHEGSLKSEVMVQVDQLPQPDQKRLREGILLQSERELYALLEDYTG